MRHAPQALLPEAGGTRALHHTTPELTVPRGQENHGTWRPVSALKALRSLKPRPRPKRSDRPHQEALPTPRAQLPTRLVSRRTEVAVLYVHRAVLEAFTPRSDSVNLECHHRNFDPADNRLENLQWSTKADNLRFTWRAGRQENAKQLRTERQREWYRAKAAAVEAERHPAIPRSIRSGGGRPAPTAPTDHPRPS